ncbi:hypothetical protein [Qipengyuania sediminis]|uniref:hypothetical protein n=1 Tax=Qipengyuania sediminis TaxID=1532023 RepID=UPI00105989BD|nr:hypothetical protein [Qipengyuania sediminis]
MALPSRNQPPHPAPDASLAAGWALLTEAGAAVAELAAIDGADQSLTPREFALRAAAAGPARLALAERTIDDLAAVLHYGLNAIAAAAAAGRDVTTAANTLWREFDHARRGLIALIERPA